MDKRQILEELGGLPEEIYDELCQGFIEDAKSKLPLLKTAALDAEYDKIKLLTHSLKGAASNLRMLDIQNAAAQLEDAGKNQRPKEELNRLVEKLNNAVEEFIV